MKSDNSNELLPVVDRDGNVTGSATRGECHGGSHLLHPVVHLHVLDRAGNLYLQKRPEWKDIQPGRWDTAVGGHVDLGETVAEALRREAAEELAIDLSDHRNICRYVFTSDRESELVSVFVTTVDTPPRPTDELDGGRFWSPAEIEAALDSGVFTPNFANEYRTILKPYLSNDD